ncbi:MAG TPA: hypothetical protein V6C84_12535 [Coleofasciculaceae cyanobacterium]|jgi:hypothetical protein
MSISNKDNTLRNARNVGTLSGSKRIGGFVGSRDKIDFAKFTLSGASEFGLTLGRVTGRASARVTLRNSRGAVLENFKSGAKPKTIAASLAAGSYYISVQSLKGNINYNLAASATPSAPPTPPTPPVPPVEGLNSAVDIGVLSGTYTNQDFVGTTDPVDFYKFTLNDAANLQARVTGSSANTRVQLIRDGNGNGLVDNEEILASGTNFSSTFLSDVTQDLPSGAYFIKVEPSNTSASTIYQLNLVATPFGGNVSPDPGNTLPTARDLGAFSGTLLAKDYVGQLDANDTYKFTLTDIANLQINVKGSSANTRIQLVRDINSNGLIDNGEVLASDSNISSTFLSSITQDVPSGAYFIKVETSNTSNSSLYELNLVATPFGGNGAPDPGNTLPTARDMGVLSSTFSAKEHVGIIDSDDFYKFTLNDAKTLQARVTATSTNTRIDLIRDTNGNGLIDNNEVVESDTNSSSTFLSNITEDLQAGTYFVRVRPQTTSRSTNYTLSLTV